MSLADRERVRTVRPPRAQNKREALAALPERCDQGRGVATKVAVYKQHLRCRGNSHRPANGCCARQALIGRAGNGSAFMVI
jgi:hypothetical protein